MPTRIVFIRHGETDWNRIKRIQGHIDIPLNETGLEQARRIAARMAREAGAGRGVDAIYASDLMRARQTAEPTVAALGLSLKLQPGLRERAYGVFQGHDSDEIADRFPDAYAVWQTRDPGFAPEGGESPRVFYHRVLHTVAQIAAEHPNGRIVCVTHGGVLDCVYRCARGLALDAPRDYPLLNASLNSVLWDEAGRASIVEWGDVAHLESASADDGLAVAKGVDRK